MFYDIACNPKSQTSPHQMSSAGRHFQPAKAPMDLARMSAHQMLGADRCFAKQADGLGQATLHYKSDVGSTSIRVILMFYYMLYPAGIPWNGLVKSVHIRHNISESVDFTEVNVLVIVIVELSKIRPNITRGGMNIDVLPVELNLGGADLSKMELKWSLNAATNCDGNRQRNCKFTSLR
ncbi:hypothetical protein BDN71DRAFT_1436998 [Pleurotus eryngii]|uniref:Uncharacterized protein n=1 Tax=Pleurotus eryngii TaxID=5323 RepID=A0A9P5ZHG2_PLEER|nr:hypothetical protein BDN71DRAFT_1436998 [Pleurotus eryngii]